MGLKDSLRNGYFAIEDKYYKALDWLEGKGLSLYPLVDAIEKRNIPSFPVVLALIIIIIAGLVLLLGGVFQGTTVSFIVKDSEAGLALQAADITVTDSAGLEQIVSTNAEGRAFVSVAPGEITILVEKSGYGSFEETIDVSESIEKTVSLNPVAGTVLKSIQLMKAGSNELITDPVTVRFSCSSPDASSFSRTEESVNGVIELQVPSNCGSLVANPVAGYSAVNGVISIASAAPQLFLQAIATDTGTVNVTVENGAGEAVSGVTVMLYRDDEILAGTSYSSSAGTASFENIATGTYYIVAHDSQGRYGGFDGSQLAAPDLKELRKDQIITFNVSLQEASAGTIRILAKDVESTDPVENATVYLKRDYATIDTAYTDSAGIAEFTVTESVEYGIQVDAAGYLIATVSGISASGTLREIYLSPATSDNTQTLVVEVVDSRGNAIDNVRLILKKPDGTIYANDRATGSDGMAEFTNLPLETYYVYAAKKGFEGKTSDPITIRPRIENRITIVLPIGWGNIELTVLSDEGQAVQGAIVEVMNSVLEEKEAEGITDIEGKYTVNIRADKKVYFKIDAADFLPYYSIAAMPDPNSTVPIIVNLAKDPGELQVKVLGFYQGEEQVPETMDLGQGEKYTAKLLLLVAKGDEFDEAGIHFRAGEALEGKTNIMEEDAIYIKGIYASTANILKGTSFTPPKGYPTDAIHLTTGDSKWANIMWENASAGAYAAEVEVQVKESAGIGQLLPMWYRAWGKKGIYTRYPKDNELAGAESTSEKQALYANANYLAASAGPTNLCNEAFCKSFSIEDLAKRTRINVVQEYDATIGSSYKLYFTISSINEQAFTNCEIEFGSETDGLRFGEYSIKDATGLESSGKAEGYSISKPIGNMESDSVVYGSIEFETEKEGNNPLTIAIKSNNQPVLNEAINVRVAAAEELRLEMIPKEVMPLIDNEILVKVSDSTGKTVSNAIVSIYLDEVLLKSTESDGQGRVEYNLEAPATGATLLVRAEKTGYRKAELETKVDQQILIVSPPKINEKLDNYLSEIEKEILLSNQTISDLTITRFSFNGFGNDLVEFEWYDDYLGAEIKQNADLNIFLTLKLTEEGALIERPAKMEGSLTITVRSEKASASFLQEIPITIRIGLGEQVDEGECLGIEPVKWEIITGQDKSESQEFTLVNDCTVDGKTIALKDFEARIASGNENGLGKFVLSSEELPEANEITLAEAYSTFADVLPEEFEGSIKLTFTPNSSIDSASGKPKIEFRATNITERGDEKIELGLPTEIHISKLSECVKIDAESPVMVETVPMNLGYGLYGSSAGYGYSPYTQNGLGGYASSYGTYGSYGSGYGSAYGGYGTGYGSMYGGSTYPYSQFDTSYYTRYYDQGEDQSWMYGFGESNFIVKNTCEEAVEIDLDVPSRIRTDSDSFSLDPDTDKTVKIEAGYRMGKYTIDVTAKLKKGQEDPYKVGTVDVIVSRPGEIDEECIHLSTDNINLSDFVGRPQDASVFNYCYDVGVRLPKAGKIIDFACQVPGQQINTFQLSEGQEQQEKIMLQAYPNPFTQTSGYINQAPMGNMPNPLTGQPYSANEYRATNGILGPGYYTSQQGNATQGYYNPMGAYPYGSSNWAYQQAYGYEGTCPLIESVYFVDEYKTGLDEETGRTLQVVDFEVKPNIQYRKQLCEYMAQMPFETLYGLRATATSAKYRAEVRATANVYYYNPFGGQDIKYFRIILNDWWGYGETLDQCMRNAGQVGIPTELMQKCNDKGSAVEDPMACINANGLDIASRFGNNQGFVPQGSFSGNTYKFTPEQDLLKVPPCSGTDSIETVQGSYTDAKSGVTLYFRAVPNQCQNLLQKGNWNIEVTVDRSSMKNVQCAKISTTVEATLSRPTQWARARTFNIPVRVNILNNGVELSQIDVTKCTEAEPAIKPTEVKTCEAMGGETGGAYTKYGFDKLLFEWAWDSIERQECDSKESKGSEKFCDAVQFSIELNKKANDIKQFVESNKNNWETANKANVKAATGSNDTSISNYMNTAELFRWVHRQQKIEDKFNQPIPGKEQKGYLKKDLVFFQGKDGKILEDESIEFAETVKARAEAVKGFQAGAWWDIIEKTEELLKELEKSESREAIVVEIADPAVDTAQKTVLESFGAEKDSAGNYVMSFNEYRLFHKAVYDKLKAKPEAERNTVQDIDVTLPEIVTQGNGTEISVATVSSDLLKEVWGKAVFKAGLLHEKDMSEESKEEAMEKAALVSNLKLPETQGEDNYASFDDFRKRAIEFQSYLVKDGYSYDLRRDFRLKYGLLALESSGDDLLNYTSFEDERAWAFGKKGKEQYTYALPEAGLYNVAIKYIFSAGTETQWNAGLDLEKELAAINESYAKNLFFELPIDGEVGRFGEGTDKATREGYGVSFSNAPEAGKTYLSYGSEEDNAGPISTTKGLVSLNFKFGETFDKTNKGTILKAGKGSFEYNPSVAIPLEIELNPVSGAGIEGMLYEISATEQGIISNEPSLFTYRAKSSASLAEPRPPAGPTRTPPAAQPQTIADFADQKHTPEQGRTLCKEIGNLTLHGFQQQLTAQKTFRGIAFVPFAREYKLVVYCSQGSAKVESENTAEEINVGAGYRKGELDLKLHEPIESKKASLASFIEKIKEEQVCVKPGDEIIELAWNKDKLLSG
ncbi:MAG: hypothetical protein JW744_01850 [Candidatus Diapherotrites archaeon]|uniref:Carboxypeptidase regulatory-like domain-containing protein n=1 Tax=Candidatus Iainarchaeum sp. TaxID=3101447 RepID=A0A939C718_9ARCH|nr:hypothetical protein [Candidatus Diapherotrites archaeon]